MEKHVFLIVFATACLLLTVALGFLLGRRDRRRLEAFHRNLGGLPGAGPDQELAWGGHRATVHFQPGFRGNPSELTLTGPAGRTGAFEVRLRGETDRLLGRFNLFRHVASGDARFDARFILVSDEPGFAAACFRSPARRAAVGALFDRGCVRVVRSAGTVQAVWSPFGLGNDVAFLPPCVGDLGALGEHLPPVPAPEPAPGLTRAGLALLLGLAWLLILGTGAILVRIRVAAPLDETGMFLASLRFSLPAMGLFLVRILRALRTRAWGAGPVVQTVVTSLVAFPGAGYLLGVAVNAGLDRAPAVVHRTGVVDTSIRSGRPTTQTAWLRSWRPGGGQQPVRVTAFEYQRLVPGRTMATVVTRPGRLGYEWLVELRFEP